MKKTIVVASSLDTKGEETLFIVDAIKKFGCKTIVVDIGVRGGPSFKGNISRDKVAKLAGSSMKVLSKINDRIKLISIMSKGLSSVLLKLYRESKDFGAVVGLGGGNGTTLITNAMQCLPIGFPKIMVSTVVNGDVSNYIKGKDILLYPSITDIAGLNPVMESILRNASVIACALAKNSKMPVMKKRENVIALTMFGITTLCVSRVRSVLESKGLRTMVFHANGAGGRTMEELIDSGLISGVVDITTTELSDELVGGTRSSGPTRLTAAGKMGLLQVVCPGAIETVNFGSFDTVPKQFKNRILIRHTHNATLMRINMMEAEQLGKIMAEKLNGSNAPVIIILPLRGFSEYNKEGQVFYNDKINRKFIGSLKKHLNKRIKLVEIDAHINDMLFADKVAELFLDVFQGGK